MSESICVLCGEPVSEGEETSSYRVEGECKGFQCTIELRKTFHNACVTKREGVNEIARAQVLDYLEAVQFNTSRVENLRDENLSRAEKIVKEMEWRRKFNK